MSENSQQMEMIRQYCKVHEIDEGDTFFVTKKLLEHYRNAIWMNGGVTGAENSIMKNEGKEEVRKWYLWLRNLTHEEFESTSIDSMIFHICRTDWILRVINVVLDRVKAFHNMGDTYYEILTREFFSKTIYTDDEIAEELSMGRSTFYRRKREAILLCGILIWEEACDRKFA